MYKMYVDLHIDDVMTESRMSCKFDRKALYIGFKYKESKNSKEVLHICYLNLPM